MKRLKWKLALICYQIVLILMQDRCMICKKHTICLKINLDAPIELLDDMCHMESCFALFIDIVSFSARLVHNLRLMHHILRNHFGRTIWYSWVKRLAWFGQFGDSANPYAR